MDKKIVAFFSLLLVFTFLYFFLIAPLFSLMMAAKSLPEKIRPIKATLAMQDFEFLPLELEYFREYLVEIDNNVGKLNTFSVIPYFGSYFSDLKIMSSSSLELLDISIGLLASIEEAIPELKYIRWAVPEQFIGGEASTSLADVASVLVKELPSYKERLGLIDEKLNKIDPTRYPRELKGIKIRSYLEEMQQLSAGLFNSFDDLVTLIGLAPELTGEKEVKNYLVFLQNDKELRPSGGVLTAYAVFTVNRGRLVLVKTVGDVVFLDDKLRDYAPAPNFIRQYVGVNRFYIKDASFSPDFKVSAEEIMKLWSKIPKSSSIDGIIILDTHFIAALVDVLGVIHVPDYGGFTSGNVVGELQKFSALAGSRVEEDKKHKNAVSAFLYELMNQAFSASTRKRAELTKKVLEESQEKHLLAYFVNEDIQNIVEKYNFGGRVREYQRDYLYVSDSNLGGDQSNRYINEAVKKSLEMKEGRIISTVEISYENIGEFDSVFNKEYQNYVRVYVPRGSKLISSTGSLVKVTQGEDLGKSFFAGYLKVAPQSKVSYTVKYELPSDILIDNRYQLLIQKQPGADLIKYEVQIADKKEEFDLLTDKEIEINL